MVVHPKECCRPKTYGELRDKLLAGVPCEVAYDNAELVKITMECWFNLTAFKVVGPANGGWVCFVPDGYTEADEPGEADGCESNHKKGE